jgi:hypothetical protein
MTVNQIAQDRQAAVGGRSAHVVSAGQRFSGGIVLFCRARLFLLEVLFLFFRKASTRDGDTLFPKLPAIATSTPYLTLGDSLTNLLTHGDLIVAWQKICTLTKSVYTLALEREYGGRVANGD